MMMSIPPPFQHPPRPSFDNQHKFANPSGWIQWKGTDVCADIHCDCGAHYHIDASFAYYVRCPACKGIFALSGHIELLKLSGEELEKFGLPSLVEPDEGAVWAQDGEEKE